MIEAIKVLLKQVNEMELDAKMDSMTEIIKVLFEQLDDWELETKIEMINQIKLELNSHSPFTSEPVDCVIWVKNETVHANDYNPNSVAPKEMDLLKRSILQDGYTQPIVSWVNGESYEVVDGFHRNRVGKEFDEVKERVHGYLPVTVINENRLDKGDRMASTIRHNRARGAHKVESMSEIVIDLKKRNWSDKKIAKELGMEQDEVLRLAQISGLAEMFADKEFSEAWEVDMSEEDEIEVIE